MTVSPAVEKHPPLRRLTSTLRRRGTWLLVLVQDPKAEPRIADQPPPHGHGLEAESCSWWRRGRGNPQLTDCGGGAPFTSLPTGSLRLELRFVLPFADSCATFAEYIKNVRTERGLRQEDVASLLGVHRRTVGDWESSANYPQKRHTRALVEMLGLSREVVAQFLMNEGIGWKGTDC